MAGCAAGAQVSQQPKDRPARSADSPSAVAERQKDKRTFDDTRYYERLSEKIPFGSDAWWRQKQIESTNE
jgi:hypothetical protein